MNLNKYINLAQAYVEYIQDLASAKRANAEELDSIYASAEEIKLLLNELAEKLEEKS